MHKSDEYGTILLKQKDKQNESNIYNFALKLLKHLPFTLDVIMDSITELLSEGVISIEGDKMFQKRMVKDNSISEKRSLAGSLGGKQTQFAKANLEANGVANVEANSEYEYEDESDSKKEDKKEPKLKYADKVLMTETERNKLVSEFGLEGTAWMIDKLNNYKIAKGKNYKSDYRAILSWVVDSWNEFKAKQPVVKSDDKWLEKHLAK